MGCEFIEGCRTQAAQEKSVQVLSDLTRENRHFVFDTLMKAGTLKNSNSSSQNVISNVFVR